jgi:hypothetical protein
MCLAIPHCSVEDPGAMHTFSESLGHFWLERGLPVDPVYGAAAALTAVSFVASSDGKVWF